MFESQKITAIMVAIFVRLPLVKKASMDCSCFMLPFSGFMLTINFWYFTG